MASHLTDPVFVVGAPRSGTTLLASLLAAHPRLSSGPEAKVFEKISSSRLDECTSDLAWPRQAVAELAGIILSGQRVIDLFDVSETSLAAYLQDQPHTAAAMISALFEAGGRLDPGTRWVEKTPNHLEHLDTITRSFPEARVVRVIRDARDVAASQVSVPWASSSRLANAWAWRELHRRTRPLVDSLPDSVLTVRYEDLLTDPEQTMRAICTHVGVDYEPAVLSPESGAGAVTTSVETWKAKNSSALDPSRAHAWMRSRDDVDTAIGVLCAVELREFGYPEVPTFRREIRAYTGGRQALEAVERTLLGAAARGIRVIAGWPAETGLLYVPSVSRLIRRRLWRTSAKIVTVRMTRALRRRSTRTLPRR